MSFAARRRRIIAAGQAVQRPIVVLIFLLGLLPGTGRGQDEQAALAGVRARIAEIEQRMAGEQEALEESTARLRTAERAVASAERALERLTSEQAALESRLGELRENAAEMGLQLQDERHELARQVRLSFAAGQAEMLKLVLNQEDPASLGRMLVYYGYLSRLRSGRIAAASAELTRLAALRRETSTAAAALTESRRQAEAQLILREAGRADRAAALALLGSGLRDSADQLEQLRADERRLTDLVLELGDVLSALPPGAGRAFSTLRGQLPWPTPGHAVNRFGDLRNGGPLRWNGLEMAAPAGSEVRAIYHGTVAFSDWLPGLGLLLIVDHGEGFLSLYGYNEVLLRAAGDAVSAGELIARVGDSGGRQQAALYFELRHNGDPVDPAAWIRRGN